MPEIPSGCLEIPSGLHEADEEGLKELLAAHEVDEEHLDRLRAAREAAEEPPGRLRAAHAANEEPSVKLRTQKYWNSKGNISISEVENSKVLKLLMNYLHFWGWELKRIEIQ